MKPRSDSDRALAFAGILQALQLVQDSAYGRPLDKDALHSSLNSILMTDADDVPQVYGGRQGVHSGLALMARQLMGGGEKPDPELSRYLVTLLHLERKLSKRSDLLERLQSGIERAHNQAGHFGLSHANTLASLAETYSQTLSTLSPRILVNGDPHLLRDSAVANRIRALLLAATRSAVLWRQCGGTRLGLLLGGRRRLVEAAGRLLEQIDTSGV
ncbi:MAG TPA: lysogenization regulator HflD [Gammaproteobacteria bacterium]|nr:lysogenization regulator HflD [Gammaproteobacteria bacterium]